MPNENCLHGIRCPNCGQEDRFFIAGNSLFEVHDDGTEGNTDIEWTGEFCACPQCDYEGKLADFQVMKDEEREEYLRSLVQACYDDNKFLRDVVEQYASEHTYADYLRWTTPE